MITIVMAAALTVALCSCGSSQTGTASADGEPQTSAQEELSADAEKEASADSGSQAQSGSQDNAGDSGFTFADLDNTTFTYSSGAGGWYSSFEITKDGSFEGIYYDSDMGDTGDEYPNGTVYESIFSGRLSDLQKVNDYTYKASLGTIEYAATPGTEAVNDGIRYEYTTAAGLVDTDELLIYMKGAPISELPESYRIWAGYHDLSSLTETELPGYGIYNESADAGFTGWSR